MVARKAAKDHPDAYDKLMKVGAYDPYQVRVQGSFGTKMPSASLQQWQDTQAMYERGDFGDPRDPASQERMLQYWSQVDTRRTLNTTPPRQLGEHRAIVGSVAKNIGALRETIDAEIKAIAGREDTAGRPKYSEDRRGPFGMFPPSQWPDLLAKRHDVLMQQRQKAEAVASFIQYIQDMVEGGNQLPQSVINWVNKVNNFPKEILTDESIAAAIPGLQQELQGGQGQQPQGGGVSFSLAPNSGGMWR
jgi:hypothetical protein